LKDVRVGSFQTSADATAMSAFLPLATTERTSLEVRFVPIADLSGTSVVRAHDVV
jgi:hypothetical protein